MSSFNPVDHNNNSNNSNNTPNTRNTSEQRPQPLYQNPHQHRRQPQQQQQQPEHHSQRRQEMFEMQHNTNFAPSSHMLTRFDGVEEEELPVIGSGISGSYEPRSGKQRLPMRLPNLNYKYPKASAQNFSPGTSLIFNAYRGGHSGLLTQPYMAAIEDGDGSHDESGQRTRKSLSQEAHADQQQRQEPSYPPHENNSYPSYRQQKTLEHQSYHSSHEHSFHPYQANGQSSDSRDYRDYPESREYHDPREHENLGIRSSQRSPGMPPSSMAMSGSIDPLSQRIEQGHDSRARVPGQHYDQHWPRDDYPPQPSTQPLPPHQHIPSDIGHPQQRWKRQENDHGNTNHPYDGNGSNSNNQYPSHQSQSQPQQRQQVKPPYSTPAIDIPQPRNRGAAASYSGEYDHRGSMDHSMRGQQHPSYPQHSQNSQNSQQPLANGPMGPGGYQSFGPRAIGPRYSLTRLNYRMVHPWQQ